MSFHLTMKFFGPKGPVIIYDRGGAESNEFLQEIFSRRKKFAAHSTLRDNFSTPTLTHRNNGVRDFRKNQVVMLVVLFITCHCSIPNADTSI